MDSGQNNMVNQPPQIKMELPPPPPPVVPVVVANNTAGPLPGGSGANNGGPAAAAGAAGVAPAAPQKKFPCHLCRRSFMHKQSLDIHMRSHTGQRTVLFVPFPFSCKYLFLFRYIFFLKLVDQ